MTRRKGRIYEVAGMRVLLWGSAEFNSAMKTLEDRGENVYGKHYIILSPEPISLEMRKVVRDWYKNFVDDLVVKGQSGKKGVRRRARRLLKEIGWIVDWNS